MSNASVQVQKQILNERNYKINKCIADDTNLQKLPLAEAQTALGKQKNKIRQRTIYKMADGIHSPCSVAHRSGIT